jgi:hypothetical protein
MTKFQYRIILLLSLFLGTLGGFLDLAVPSLIPDALRVAQEEYDAGLPTPRLVIGLVFGLPGAGLALISTYGLYRFRRWAPRLAVVGTALTLIGWLGLGFSGQSGFAAAFSYLASYLWGGCVMLCYAAPYRSWFIDSVDVMASHEA